MHNYNHNCHHSDKNPNDLIRLYKLTFNPNILHNESSDEEVEANSTVNEKSASESITLDQIFHQNRDEEIRTRHSNAISYLEGKENKVLTITITMADDDNNDGNDDNYDGDDDNNDGDDDNNDGDDGNNDGDDGNNDNKNDNNDVDDTNDVDECNGFPYRSSSIEVFEHEAERRAINKTRTHAGNEDKGVKQRKRRRLRG